MHAQSRAGDQDGAPAHHEVYLADPIAVIKGLLSALEVGESQAEVVMQAQVTNLPRDKYENALLSPTHVTDPKRKRSVFDSLAPEVKEKITRDQQVWLQKYGCIV